MFYTVEQSQYNSCSYDLLIQMLNTEDIKNSQMKRKRYPTVIATQKSAANVHKL